MVWLLDAGGFTCAASRSAVLSGSIVAGVREAGAEEATGRSLRFAEEADAAAPEDDEDWFQIAATCDENEPSDGMPTIWLPGSACVQAGLAAALTADMLVVDIEHPPAT